MKYYVQHEQREFGIEVLHSEAGTVVRLLGSDHDGAGHDALVDFAPVQCNVDTGEGLYSIIADGKSYQLFVEPVEGGFRMMLARHRFDMHVMTEREWRLNKVAPRQGLQTGAVTVNSPMPGLVKGVMVGVGDVVAAGQSLIVLEAMKMENDIASPRAGQITAVHVQPGTVVEGGKPLISIES